MANIEKIVDIPASALESVRQDFESEGARVKTIRQTDGRYTVSARFLIDQAIAESRTGEWLLYAFAVIFPIVGLAVLMLGLLTDQALVSLSGAIVSFLFVPTIRAAVRIRRENVVIRLLEIPLSRADTAQAAAEALRQLIEQSFKKGHEEKTTNTKT